MGERFCFIVSWASVEELAIYVRFLLQIVKLFLGWERGMSCGGIVHRLSHIVFLIVTRSVYS